MRDGDKVLGDNYGHSFIFLNYVYTGSAISGIAMADQGFQSSHALSKGEYAFWVAANLTIGS